MPASTSTRPAHLSSASDDWPTPADFYDALDAEFGFVLDVCASSANHKTTQFYALDHPDNGRRDGLAQDWAAQAAALGGPVWMNPPYGRPIAAWMSKAFEAAQAGATVVTLVPVRADTAWWHDLVLATGAQVRHVRGRLRFGNAVNTAAFSSAVVVYRPTDQVGAPGPVRTTPAHPFTPARPALMAATKVARAIANYTPTCLPPARWAQCADVARAAVAATNPPTVKVARDLLLHLCQFLSTPCGWTGEGAPDLATLLTAPTIAAYSYTAGGVANRASGVCRRTDLLRIARAVGSVPAAPTSYAKTTTTALRPELLAAARQPVPLAGIAQAWERAHGRALPAYAFRPVVATLLASCENTARQPERGTFWLPAPLRVLAEATDQPVKEVGASMNKPSTTGAPKPAGKKMSRRAVVAYAKANLAAAQAHRGGPTLADQPEPGALPPQVGAAIEAYQPHPRNLGSWDDIADLTRRLCAGYAPPSPRNARSAATHISTFLRWFSTWPGREDVTAALDARELLAPGLVDTYLAFAPGSAGSRATQRAVLRRALNALDGSKRAVKLPYQPVAAPYTPAQCARFVALARHQPTTGRKRNMAFLVGLGLGAGLDGRDLRAVTRADLVDVWLDPGTPILTVTVTSTRGQRTVPVRAGYDLLVREGLALHDQGRRGPNAVLLGLDPTRDHITSPVTERAVTADVSVSVDIEASRLRNTWLVAAMCAPVPLADLLRAAGLRSARTVGDLLAYCPDADPAVIAAALAAMGERATTGGRS
jgi:phage N-6-adenine-methyltransferase